MQSDSAIQQSLVFLRQRLVPFPLIYFAPPQSSLIPPPLNQKKSKWFEVL